jgi:4-carboxymuconolactone decarboxylase
MTSSSPQHPMASAPKLAELTEQLLFGDIWQRPELSARDRCLITVAALVALYRNEQLPLHLERALANGLSRVQLSELITHLAFYSGWPTAHSALLQLDRIPVSTSEQEAVCQ